MPYENITDDIIRDERHRLTTEGYKDLTRIAMECKLDLSKLENRRIIIFTGPKGSGKDTAGANPLTQKYNAGLELFVPETFRRIPMAGAAEEGGVKDVCRIKFGLTAEEMEDAVLKETRLGRWPWVEPRKLLQDEANGDRERYGGDFHVRGWLRRVAQSDDLAIIVTDLRFPEELRVFLALNATIIWMDCVEAQLKLQAQINAQNTLATNVSESHWELIQRMATHVVNNNYSIQHTQGQILRILEAQYREPQYWETMYVVR